MTDVVLDTVALVRLLEGALPPRAHSLVRQAEEGRGTLYLPEIVLAEFLWLAERGRVRFPSSVGLDEVFDELRGREYLLRSSLSEEAWSRFRRIKGPDLHDRMIAADALARELPLMTNDEVLQSLEPLQTVWR
jgi:predicted nucleic acid-binding protein